VLAYLREGREVGVDGEERLQERVRGGRGRELLEAAGERGEDVGGGERARPVDAGERDVAYGEEEWRRGGVVLRRVGVGGGHWCGGAQAGRGGLADERLQNSDNVSRQNQMILCYFRLALGVFGN